MTLSSWLMAVNAPLVCLNAIMLYRNIRLARRLRLLGAEMAGSRDDRMKGLPATRVP